jgi:PadR family transcriptional regulator, regulatory protein PadR
MTTEPAPFLKGTLDVLVLKALAWTPMHGFELARWLEARSGEAFALDEAAVYQALYRLEGRGLVAAEWGRSEMGRRARYYHLTTAGRGRLEVEAERWRRYALVVAEILDTAPGEA